MRGDGSYLLGFVKIFNYQPRDLLLDRSISLKYFFEHRFRTSLSSSSSGGAVMAFWREVHVIQVVVGGGGEYYAVVKTRWIRLIQKTWKEVVRSRNHKVEMRRSLESLRVIEMTGRFPEGMRWLYGLRGMLAKEAEEVDHPNS